MHHLFYILHLSKCKWVNGPFAFFHGCYNGGIDWNSFMAPIDMVVVLALPLSIVYWILRCLQVNYRLLLRLIGWTTGKPINHPGPEPQQYSTGPFTLLSAFVVFGAFGFWLSTLLTALLSEHEQIPAMPFGFGVALISAIFGVRSLRSWRHVLSREAARRLQLLAVLVAAMVLWLLAMMAQRC